MAVVRNNKGELVGLSFGNEIKLSDVYYTNGTALVTYDTDEDDEVASKLKELGTPLGIYIDNYDDTHLTIYFYEHCTCYVDAEYGVEHHFDKVFHHNTGYEPRITSYPGGVAFIDESENKLVMIGAKNKKYDLPPYKKILGLDCNGSGVTVSITFIYIDENNNYLIFNTKTLRSTRVKVRDIGIFKCVDRSYGDSHHYSIVIKDDLMFVIWFNPNKLTDIVDVIGKYVLVSGVGKYYYCGLDLIEIDTTKYTPVLDTVSKSARNI
jgi:hypothetical protein